MKFTSVIGCGVFNDKLRIPTFGKQSKIVEDGIESFRNNGFVQVPVAKYEEETVATLRKRLHEHIDFFCDNMEKAGNE